MDSSFPQTSKGAQGQVTEVTQQEGPQGLTNDAYLSRFLVAEDMGFTCRYIKTPESPSLIHKRYTSLRNTITFHFKFPSKIESLPEWWISYPETGSGAVKIDFVPAARSKLRDSRLWIPCKPTANSASSSKSPRFTFKNYRNNMASLTTFPGYVLEPLDSTSTSMDVLQKLVDKFYYSSKVAGPKIPFPEESTWTPICRDPHPRADPDLGVEFRNTMVATMNSILFEKTRRENELTDNQFENLNAAIQNFKQAATAQWDTIDQLRQTNFNAKMASVLKLTQDLESFQQKVLDMYSFLEGTVQTANDRKNSHEVLKTRMDATVEEIVNELGAYTLAKRDQLEDIQGKAAVGDKEEEWKKKVELELQKIWAKRRAEKREQKRLEQMNDLEAIDGSIGGSSSDEEFVTDQEMKDGKSEIEGTEVSEEGEIEAAEMSEESEEFEINEESESDSEDSEDDGELVYLTSEEGDDSCSSISDVSVSSVSDVSVSSFSDVTVSSVSDVSVSDVSVSSISDASSISSVSSADSEDDLEKFVVVPNTGSTEYNSFVNNW